MSDTERPNFTRGVLTLLLGLACGFLTFNFHHIMKSSHIHVSLAHHHRTTAFCAFTGCKLQDSGTGHVVLETPSPTPSAEEIRISNITAILSTRVCGSPAIDGYAHVVPKCLEESPTNKWWQEYYENGGKQSDLVAHIEPASDYDGLAVVWGIGNNYATAEECAAHCKRHMPKQVPGPFDKLPCNAFAFCPDDVCFEPDAHHHTKGNCWLKFTEGPVSPEVNMRGDLPPEYRKRHPTAPKRVQWISGVLLPPGVKPTNGTYGPRWSW